MVIIFVGLKVGLASVVVVTTPLLKCYFKMFSTITPPRFFLIGDLRINNECAHNFVTDVSLFGINQSHPNSC